MALHGAVSGPPLDPKFKIPRRGWLEDSHPSEGLVERSLEGPKPSEGVG